MFNLAKRILPESVRVGIKSALALPSLYYARIAFGIWRQRLLGGYRPRFGAGSLPMMKGFLAYEDMFSQSGQNFDTIVSPYVSKFRWSLGRLYNGQFESIDAELYYSVIRHFKPNLVIEVGSGHSTHFAMDAIRRNRSGHIVSIDPSPRRPLPREVEHIQSRVEDVGQDLFAELSANDILFIDSSHRTAEASFHCHNILPHLDEGVLIHHHDFVYPYAVYFENDAVSFGEPDVLLEFYSANRRTFDILVCASYVTFGKPSMVTRLVKSYKLDLSRRGGSLWTRKKSADRQVV